MPPRQKITAGKDSNAPLLSPLLALARDMESLSRLRLTENPFSSSPDPRFLWMSDLHRATIIKTRQVVEFGQGLVAIFGEPGVGKTTVARRLYQEYRERTDLRAAFLPNPARLRTNHALLREVCIELNLPLKRNFETQQATLQEYLAAEWEAEHRVVLIIDEVQLLTAPQLELLRQMLNYETADTKLMQIIIIGELPTINRKLSPHRGLVSRIMARSTLDPLSEIDTRDMVNWRVQVAGRREPLFDDDSLHAIFLNSRGYPRQVVKVCFHAIRLALMENPLPDMITLPLVDLAIHEAGGNDA